jgi:hypothetical protein
LICDYKEKEQIFNSKFEAQLLLLRGSCTDFDFLIDKQKQKQESSSDLQKLIKMVSYLTPGFELEIIAILCIAAAKKDERLCSKQRDLEVFKLLK